MYMYAHECTQQSSGIAQMVPKLKEAYTLCVIRGLS